MVAEIVVVKNLLPGIADRFGDQVATAINVALVETGNAADPATRVDTGALRAGKVFTFAAAGNPSGELLWTQDYAAYQNGGTRYMAGTNFANIGVEAATPGFLASLSDLGL